MRSDLLFRYVGSWLGEPLGLNPSLRQTSAIVSLLGTQLTLHKLQLLLNGHLNDPALNLSLSQESLSCDLRVRRQLQQLSLDHIIATSRGGQDHPQNYFLMSRQVNNYFDNSWTAEKVAYIGPQAALAAGSWHAQVAWYHPGPEGVSGVNRVQPTRQVCCSCATHRASVLQLCILGVLSKYSVLLYCIR